MAEDGWLNLTCILWQMASELHGMLSGAVSIETGELVKPVYGEGHESFLRHVVSPIYTVIWEVL